MQWAVGSGQSAVTRAVIIGISDYQEPLIPDLKYADQDAKAFAEWLRTPAGGNVPDEYIFLHTNKEATNAQMIMSLDWLIEESREGDRAFIYFSGHGDVERVTKYNNGYLLGYDSPPAVYGAGAFAVNYLKDIIATLSDNGVQVFLISDACRAGKLAGSSANGSQVTASRLAQQFANEIKILSCQPDEFSIEGEQWGGGRGCFSYHLENALYGFADKNKDAEINLMELGRYLEDKVSAEAAPGSQFPMVEGPAKEKIAFVDADLFSKKQNELKNNKTEFLAIDNKGLEEIILAEVDTNIQKIYEQFLVAIDSNYLMSPEGESANDYYDVLMANNEIEKLHGTVKRKFVVALMDEGQQIINKVLQTDPQMVDNIYAGNVKSDHLLGYFNRAAEILGKGHYVYNELKAKELYFKAKTYRKENYPDKTKVWGFKQKHDLLQKAIGLDSTLAVLYVDLAFTYEWSSEERTHFLEKAISFAPNWTLGYYLLARRASDSANPRKGIALQKKAMALDSNFLPPYNWISWNYVHLGMKDSAQYWQNRYVHKFFQKRNNHPEKITAFECVNAGSALWGLRKPNKAKEVLLLGEQISNGKMKGIYEFLGVVYTDLQEFENAILAFEKRNTLGLSPEFCHGAIGAIYFNFKNDLENTAKAFSKIHSMKNAEAQGYILQYHYYTGDYDSALTLSDTLTKIFPEEYIFHFYSGEINQQLNSPQKAANSYRLLLDSLTLSFTPNNIYYPNYLFRAIAHHRLENDQAFNRLLVLANEKLSDDPWLHFSLARIYAMTNQKDKAIASLYKAIDLGWESNPLLLGIHGTLCDPFLNPIRESDEYKELVQKYFLEYYDIATRVPGKK